MQKHNECTRGVTLAVCRSHGVMAIKTTPFWACAKAYLKGGAELKALRIRESIASITTSPDELPSKHGAPWLKQTATARCSRE